MAHVSYQAQVQQSEGEALVLQEALRRLISIGRGLRLQMLEDKQGVIVI